MRRFVLATFAFLKGLSLRNVYIYLCSEISSLAFDVVIEMRVRGCVFYDFTR